MDGATGEVETLDLLAALYESRWKVPVIVLTQNGTPLEVCCGGTDGGDIVCGCRCGGVGAAVGGRVAADSGRAPRHLAPQKYSNPRDLLDAVGIMAVSQPMQDLIVQAYRAAQVSDATVVIHGESGTGKQLLAEAIHRLDPKRSRFAFVPVNCAAIPGSLAESELFGHKRGAFTGATEARAGYFRSANKGTIMLDEVSELPLSLQPKLLRVLQEGRVLAVGADKEEAIDVRVIAASNVSLQEKVANGTFRFDLYQRLNVIHLSIPPLRQRAEDIPLLVMHFVSKYQHYCGEPIKEVDPRVYELLRRRLGNGNVRELENVMRQTLVFKAQGERIELADLPRYLFQGKEMAPASELIPTALADHLVTLIRERRLTLRQAITAFEKSVISQAAKHNPSLSKVQLAKALGLPRRTLYYKMDAPKGK